MLNPIAIVAQELGESLANTYRHYYSSVHPEYASFLGAGASLVMERLGNSNALYHDAHHTAMVTLCGQQIAKGRLLCGTVEARDWFHFIVALLLHDIGYVRGICDEDTETEFVINEAGDKITLPRGASDASLTPYHVDRAKIYVRQRFEGSNLVDAERIADMIEMTRFPVPEGTPLNDLKSEGALVRAADLIGQMGDPFYHRKCNGLFAEFVECGTAEKLGYSTAADLTQHYPEFFWSNVEPVIGPALEYLRLTTDGKNWIANLYCNLFQAENNTHHIGPYPG